MAWSDVRPYFKAALDAKGYTLWDIGFFEVENLPETVTNRAYHITLTSVDGTRQNQTDQESTLTVELRTIYCGYRYPSEAIDTAVSENEEILKSLVSPKARTTTPGILNVEFDRSDIASIDKSNDNTVVVTSIYNVKVITAV